MKVLDNVGLGLLIFSIVSVMFWSPRPYSISRDLDNAIDKVSQKDEQIWEKAKNMPSKVNSVTKNIISGMKDKIIDSENLYRNSLTQTNEENVKPALNEISNWIGINKDPSTREEHLIKAKEKACEAKDASVKAGGHILDATNIASKDLKDTIYRQNVEAYKQTAAIYDQTRKFAKEKTSHIINNVEAVVEKTDEWVANHAHDIFDKYGVVANIAENKIDEIIDATFKKVDTKNSIKFPNNNVSNIVGFFEENPYKKDLNESNIHNNLQLLGTNNMESDVQNASEIVHNNVRLLGVDNSDDFITENAHKNPQELGEQLDQMSKDTGLNLIERSFTEVNNLWSTFMGDGKIENKLNSHKESLNSDYKSTYDQPVHRQNERYYEDTKKYHHEVSDQHNKHSDDDSYDDNYEGVNEGMKKHSNNLQNKIGGTYKRYRPNNYYDYAQRYGEERYGDVKDKVGQYYEGVRTGYEGAKIGGRVGTLYDGLHGTYEGAKIGANVGYKGGKHIQGANNHAHKYYNDARHKASESYKIAKDMTRKVGENIQQIESNIIDYGDDEDYNDFDEDW